jgi:hypothetical protein
MPSALLMEASRRYRNHRAEQGAELQLLMYKFANSTGER